jgi:hypothetical protein
VLAEGDPGRIPLLSGIRDDLFPSIQSPVFGNGTQHLGHQVNHGLHIPQDLQSFIPVARFTRSMRNGNDPQITLSFEKEDKIGKTGHAAFSSTGRFVVRERLRSCDNPLQGVRQTVRNMHVPGRGSILRSSRQQPSLRPWPLDGL